MCVWSGWLEPLLDRIAKDSTAVVCPVIDNIADDTLAYQVIKRSPVGGFSWGLEVREGVTRVVGGQRWISCGHCVGGGFVAWRECFVCALTHPKSIVLHQASLFSLLSSSLLDLKASTVSGFLCLVPRRCRGTLKGVRHGMDWYSV